MGVDLAFFGRSTSCGNCMFVAAARWAIVLFGHFVLFDLAACHVHPNAAIVAFDHRAAGKWSSTKARDRIPRCII